MKKEMGEIINELKVMLQDRLMLPFEPEEIDEEALIFEVVDVEEATELPTLGLDSVDGLEIMVGIQNLYHVKLDAEKNPQAYKSVRTLAEAVCKLLEEKNCEA
jgi:acyl carrier protein